MLLAGMMAALTKWPRLLVAGDPVTEAQANDILIRSNPRYLVSNDRSWTALVAREYGIPLDPHGGLDWKAAAEVFERLGVLHLNHLANHRIMSPTIVGPHGWCAWDGRIGCSTYNIGKWPTREDVQEDLTAIAAAWPFLRMDVQLVTDEGDGDLAAMWQVADGHAAFVEPGDPLPIHDLTDTAIMLRLFTPGAERGVTLNRLRQALAQVRTKKAHASNEDPPQTSAERDHA
ncbi:hypothetical protein [Spirillospora sp. CA-294931]|uniref:hypothetical protein n=1 Tax=Spirillospora sp. CA-294931 TaxID=3240042 RepID=UPI003D8DD7FF